MSDLVERILEEWDQEIYPQPPRGDLRVLAEIAARVAIEEAARVMQLEKERYEEDCEGESACVAARCSRLVRALLPEEKNNEQV